MSKEKTTMVHNIKLHSNQATTLTFNQLYDWVIWQFPEQKEGGLSGAVRPPILDAAWYPALIYPNEKRIRVYSHLDASYNTPEEAAKRLFVE